MSLSTWGNLAICNFLGYKGGLQISDSGEHPPPQVFLAPQEKIENAVLTVCYHYYEA